MTLPADIVKYIKKKIIRCVVVFLLLQCVTIAISALTWNYFASRVPLAFHIGIIILINAVPFFVAKFPKNLIDSAWSGEIVAVNIKTKSKPFSAGGKVFPYTSHQIILDVKRDNGKVISIMVREIGEPNNVITQLLGYTVPNQGDIKAFIEYYSIGDKIYHFYGLKHYYLEKEKKDFCICVICGAENKNSREKCVDCGHTLIKNIGDND